MKYKILYNYDTGDSFRNEYGLEEYLELEFNDIEVAKQNLKRIEEHYKQYKECNGYSSKKRNDQDIFTENINKDWFVKKTKPCIFTLDGKISRVIDDKDIKKYEANGYQIGELIDDYYANHCIILYADNGNPFQIHCPWCGYFETLNHVEIVEDKSDRIIYF